MTPLRQQLVSAGREYEAIRYPGDLSQELLSPPMRFRGGYFLGAILTGAIAASAMLGMMLARPVMMRGASHSRPAMTMVRELEFPQKMPFGLPSLPSLPRMAQHLSLREMAPSLMPREGLHVPSLEDMHLPLLSASTDRA